MSCEFQVFVNWIRSVFFNNQNVLSVLFHMIDISILDIQTVASKYLLQKDSDNWSCYAW